MQNDNKKLVAAEQKQRSVAISISAATPLHLLQNLLARKPNYQQGRGLNIGKMTLTSARCHETYDRSF